VSPERTVNPCDRVVSGVREPDRLVPPAVMPHGLSMLQYRKLLTLPRVVIRPTGLPRLLVNQSAPSGPVMIPRGLRIVGSRKLVTARSVLIRPIELPR
jgi:hypothetical protein